MKRKQGDTISTRRRVLKSTVFSGASMLGIGSLASSAVADPEKDDIIVPCSVNDGNIGTQSCGGGGSNSPKSYSIVSEIDTRDYYGNRGTLKSEAGSYLEYRDMALLDGKWHYVYLTESFACNAFERDSDGALSTHKIYDGHESLRVKVNEYESSINTQYYDDSDWGVGVVGHQHKDYNYGDAAINSVASLLGIFDATVAQVTTAEQIYEYWDKASKGGHQFDGIDEEWLRYQLQNRVGHYVRYFHAIPEDYGGESINASATNTMNRTLYDPNIGYTTNQIPQEDYSTRFSYSMYVPEQSSHSIRTNNETGQKRVKNLSPELRNLAISKGIKPNDRVTVALDSPVSFEKD